jgi:RNA polymerase sigma factor (sigma-70 family)
MRASLTALQLAVIQEHMWIVTLHVKSVTRKHGPFIPAFVEDLKQAGSTALVEAILLHDSKKGSFGLLAYFLALFAMLNLIRAETRHARLLLAGHRAASLHARNTKDKFRVMKHEPSDARGFLDDGADGIVAAYLAASAEAAMEESSQDGLEARQEHARAIEALPEAQAELSDEEIELLKLTIGENFTQKQASARLNIGVSTVYRRTQRALYVLRSALHRYEIDEAPAPLDYAVRRDEAP